MTGEAIHPPIENVNNEIKKDSIYFFTRARPALASASIADMPRPSTRTVACSLTQYIQLAALRSVSSAGFAGIGHQGYFSCVR